MTTYGPAKLTLVVSPTVPKLSANMRQRAVVRAPLLVHAARDFGESPAAAEHAAIPA